MEQTIKLDDLLSFVAFYPTPITFNWKVNTDSFIHTNMLLGSVDTPKGRFNIVSHMAGTVKSLPKDSRDTLPIRVVECDHDTSYGDMCVYCGEVPKNIVHRTYCGFNSKIAFTLKKALEEEKKYMDQLFESKKLMLVLDIDHTLVHTCINSTVGSTDDCKKFTDKSGYAYMVKFRPFLSEFLNDINPLFDTYIYSHGSQKYANNIVSLIDPKEATIKKSKVIGREEMETNPKLKNLENLLPADQTVSIIIDDRNDVWANKKNLIMIFPYVYFDCEMVSYDLTIYPRLSGKSRDCSLFYFGKLLKNIHSLFYDVREKGAADVRNIIDFVKVSVLKSVAINLSLLEKTTENLFECAEYKTAAEMGALITTQITDSTLVLLWKYREDELVREAEEKGGKLVDMHWLILSSRYWRKLPVEPFLISKQNPAAYFNELKLVEEMREKLDKNWKYEYYNEILDELIESGREATDYLNKKKKVAFK
eukprot:TRINITY_DN11254_c0_g1_i1.p1 TRINITY_DN11254_c0_g1~~TRINITY_DN11254_c0_g1_i1.p1  ORF type:complete len:478 (-),score=90.38 TRINITY_DN11254_c0_g1_i1:138-1571(-)